MLSARITVCAAAGRISGTRRGLATAVETPFKVAAVDHGQPTTSVTVVVKAGSRYETTPGVAHLLKNFAFKATSRRSALRTVRESELYGGVLSATLGREHVALTADFLKGDEEYFVDVLSGVLTSSTFAQHELHEVVAPQVEAESHAASRDPVAVALDVAHSLAFRKGLGNPLFASQPVSLDAIKAYAAQAFTKENVAVVGSGISNSTLAQLVQNKLGSLPSGSNSSSATKYFGGESRVSTHGGLPTLFIGFGTEKPAPALSVLAAYLDPTPSIKWTEGTSPLAKLPAGVTAQIVHDAYSDGALFGVLIQGNDVAALTEAGKRAVQAIKGAAEGLKGDAFAQAVTKSKYAMASALENGRDVSSTMLAYKLFSNEPAAVVNNLELLDGVKAADVSKAAKTLTATATKATYVAVGNVASLPYGDQLGL